MVEPAFEEGDGGVEVVVEGEQQVDVVEVFVAREAMSEIVAWVDGGAHFAAAWAEEAEVAFAHFGGRPFPAEGGDGDGHGQVVADAAQRRSETKWQPPSHSFSRASVELNRSAVVISL